MENQKGSILKNIVSNVIITKSSSEYRLLDEKAEEVKLTPEDIDLEVVVYYVDGSQKKSQVISAGVGYDGYAFSYEALKVDVNNDFVVTYTTVTSEQFEVRQLYDNGTVEILAPDQYTISETVIEKVGDNLIVIETKDTERKTTVCIKGVGLGSLSVDYIGQEKMVGDSITVSDLDLAATYENGGIVCFNDIKEADVCIVAEMLTKDVIENRYAKVEVTYADRKVTLQIPVTIISGTETLSPAIIPEVTGTPVILATLEPEMERTAETG